MFQVGFEMASLSPLVPGVHEHQRILERQPRCAFQTTGQPTSVQLRSRILEHEPSPIATTGVVPHRSQARKSRPDRIPAIKHPVDKLGVIMHGGNASADSTVGIPE